jgi:glycolate oxidase
LEFLDRMTIGCVEDYAKIEPAPRRAALLLMETDGHPSAVADEAERMLATGPRPRTPATSA